FKRGFDLTKLADAGEDERGSHVWMTGKRHLSARCENSDVPGVTSFCRKDECGFGEIELTCDLLHLIGREAVCLRQDGQRVSAETRLCKHITSVITILHSTFRGVRKSMDRM